MTKQRLKLYNTESKQKEEIFPINGRTVRMYTCGPTVYNFAHIGNFRTYVFEDLLRRTIKFFGFSIEQAMNLTDVDDKTIKGALDKKISLDAFTQPYKDAFFEDLKTLGIEKVEHYPQATDYIPEMITIIQKLLDTGVAYRGHDESIYFAISKFPSYGRLSHLHLNELQAGASNRVALDEYDKENVCDFVLWKAYDPQRDGEIYWESPFGKGRPGWHIECSAMAMKLLGETLDIHVGGVDNMFPHHENEIAQSEAYSCRHFVKHWLHAEHLLVDHKKMSKSLGNFYTLRDLINKGYTGRQVRYMLLQTHYRTQLNFTFAGLDGTKSTLERLSDFIQRLQAVRREKMGRALDLILEKALPDNPQKKDVRERILFDVQADKRRDILDADQIRPMIERCLHSMPERGQVLDRILTEVKAEKERTVLKPILEKTLQGHPETNKILSTIIHDVQDEKETDILDPSLMKPILQKALKEVSQKTNMVESILHDLKVKKDHGFILPLIDKTMEQFTAQLADDLNISAALAALFDMVREVNGLCDQGKIGISEAEDVLDFLARIDQVLNVLPLQPEEEEIPAELVTALKKRETARLEKNWKMADECRDLIQSRGYLIEDTPQGARLKKRTL
ncbi:MAG: cysteine--tRNA ligase [Verrucomicrobia bacterium]|nr:cysteine--tRNA ligase [Verrucomicrobiota bacterium]